MTHPATHADNDLPPMSFALADWLATRGPSPGPLRNARLRPATKLISAWAVACAVNVVLATAADAEPAPTVQITVPMEIPAPATEAEAQALQVVGVDYVRVYQVVCANGRVLRDATGATTCTGAWERASTSPAAQEPFQPRDTIIMQVPVPLGTSYWAAVYHWFAYVEGGAPTSTEQESPLNKIVSARVSVSIESPQLRIIPTECKRNAPCVREVPAIP